MTYNNLKDIVNSNGGITNFRFFTELETYESTGFGFAVSTGKFRPMECRLATATDEELGLESDLYSLSREYPYKIKVIPVDARYRASTRTMYCEDLFSEFRDGFALVKNDGDHIVRDVQFGRPFAGTKYLEYFYGDLIVSKDNEILMVVNDYEI